jgi:cysteine desulfurase
MDPQVLEAMLPWMTTNWANPSSSYRAAKEARKAVEKAREQVAALIGARPEEMVFTSGGTESTNTALKWLARWIGRKNGRVVSTAIEHSAVLRVIENFAQVGYAVDRCGVTGGGRLDMNDYRAACERAREGGGFASVMWVNNETGIIQPIEEACEIAKRCGLAFHSDAIQAVGKIGIDVSSVDVDYLSVSAHKFHGPKGVGALHVKEGLRFEPLLRGGGQEIGRRSGTENVAGIVGMGVAAELALAALAEDPGGSKVGAIRDRFEHILLEQLRGVVVNGDQDFRVAGTSHVSFAGCEAAGLLILLDDAGVACSAGSACMTGKQQPSHVQKAMGLSDEVAKSSLRFSFSRASTMEDAEMGAMKVIKAVEKLRKVQGGGVTGPVMIYSAKPTAE